MSKILNAILEADMTDKILRDPGRAKQLSIAWKHDKTLPKDLVASLGPKPDEKRLAKIWSDMLEQTLEDTMYGDLSRDYKFADWLTRLYTTGTADWEDISGEGGDALSGWHALSIRNLLQPQDQDLNKFKTLQSLQRRVTTSQNYSAELRRIKNAEEIAKMKRDAKEVVLIDNDRYWVAIPMNYGACYGFNNTGHSSNFCTGGSNGASWVKNYAPQGPIVMIVDKSNIDNKDGKWQMHAPTDQLVNSVQENRHDSKANDEKFAKLFPGLMFNIVRSMQSHADDIAALSKDTMGRPYNTASAINDIKRRFPKSVNSGVGPGDFADDDENTAVAIPDSHYTIREDLRPWLAQNFENNIDADITVRRGMQIETNDGSGPFITPATSADDAILRVISGLSTPPVNGRLPHGIITNVNRAGPN